MRLADLLAALEDIYETHGDIAMFLEAEGMWHSPRSVRVEANQLVISEEYDPRHAS